MKKLILLIVISFISLQCQPQQKMPNDKEKSEIKPTKNEDGQWDIEVLDSQFDYFLTAIARPKSMYTEPYLKNKNTFLVSEWNSYYYSGRYREIIESSIDYNANENYGFDFQYKLYQVFVFVKWKYGLKMQNLGSSEGF